MMKRRAMRGSSTAMCVRLCAWPRDWRGLMPRPARPSKSATTRPPPWKSAPPPGDPAVVATTTANPLPNCRSSAPAANGVHSTPKAQNGGPYKASASPPSTTTRRSSAPAANGVRSTPRARNGGPYKASASPPSTTTRRSSAPAANGVHSTPRARNGGPLEATLPEPDRDPLQLLRRRFGTQTQVFADSPPARGGQVAPLTQGLKHTELLPLGCQLTGLDLLVQAPAGTVAGQTPTHLAQRHYHLIPPRLLHGLQLAPQSGIGLQSMRAQPAGGQQQQHVLAVLILQPQQQLLHLRLRIQPAGVIGQAGHRLYPRR